MADPHASDYAALRAFAAVAEALSFSRAAAALGVSASSLSQAVQGLEERVGARLLNRTTRSVSLTDAGDALLRRVRPAVDELGAAMDEARARRGRIAGTVRVHAFPIAAELFIQPMLGRFARDHPDVVLDLTLDDAVVDLVAGGFDAGLRLGEVIERDMATVPLGPELRQVAIASAAFLAEHGRPETPHDLLVHRCLRWRWRGRAEPYAWEFHRDGRWFSVAVDGPLIADRREVCVQAAIDGAGVAFAVESVVRDRIETGVLVPLLEDWSAPFPGFFLCHPRQKLTPPALRAFLNAVAATA